jgi:hypothetical protein
MQRTGQFYDSASFLPGHVGKKFGYAIVAGECLYRTDSKAETTFNTFVLNVSHDPAALVPLEINGIHRTSLDADFAG